MVVVIRQFYRLLLCLCLCLASFAGQAAQREAVVVPDAAPLPENILQTQLTSTPNGARLTLVSRVDQARVLLKAALTRLGIPMTGVGTRDQPFLTDWVRWIYNPKSGKGGSHVRIGFLSSPNERHRFRFIVSAGNTGSVIQIEDAEHQREIDIAPDSSYSWLEWKDFKAQPGAARAFLQRLQGDIESALTSRVLTPKESAAAYASVPLPVSPPPSEPPIQNAPASVSVKTDSGEKDRLPPSAAVISAVPAVTVVPALVVPAAAPSPVAAPQPQSAQRDFVPLPVNNVPANPGTLFVRADVVQTWRSLLRALSALNVSVKSADPQQHLLITGWIEGRYDSKNHQLRQQPARGGDWAFSFTGKGRQRQRFQMIVVPAVGGSLVYAYHTGFQEQYDRTPDSSQTLLAWRDLPVDPQVATAFVRLLRLLP